MRSFATAFSTCITQNIPTTGLFTQRSYNFVLCFRTVCHGYYVAEFFFIIHLLLYVFLSNENPRVFFLISFFISYCTLHFDSKLLRFVKVMKLKAPDKMKMSFASSSSVNKCIYSQSWLRLCRGTLEILQIFQSEEKNLILLLKDIRKTFINKLRILFRTFWEMMECNFY